MATISAAEFDCRAFALRFDTPHVRRAIRLAETGQLTWQQVAEVFRRSLAAGLTEVSRSS